MADSANDDDIDAISFVSCLSLTELLQQLQQAHIRFTPMASRRVLEQLLLRRELLESQNQPQLPPPQGDDHVCVYGAITNCRSL
ncbi:hypothetical protein ACA910_003594 [Epithemia clementina (nom. ined.)]